MSLRALVLAVFVGLSGGHPAPLPALDLPNGTLLLREHLVAGAGERSGNWRERIDDSGCWSVARNTWLWVHDPVLLALDDPRLFYNSDFSEPWFCLSVSQRERLAAALAVLPKQGSQTRGSGLLERWTAVVEGRPRSVVVPAGRPGRTLAPLASVLAEIATEGVWGLSADEPPD